jgi:competence protein ComEC
MNRPFSIPALALIAGILVGDRIGAPLFLLFTVSFVLAIGCFVSERWQSRLLWPLVFFFAWTNLQCRTALVSPHDARKTLGDRHQIIELRGRLMGSPRERISDRDGKEFRHSLALLRLAGAVRDNEVIPIHGLVVVHTPAWLDDEFHDGRPVAVSGVVGPPDGAVAEGLFDYRDYLNRRGIHHTLDVASPTDWKLLPRADETRPPPLSKRFQRWAQTNLARGLPEDDPTVRLLWAISLGWKTALTDEVARPFMRSGTMHLFAISGLHVAMISGILVSLLRALQIPRAGCGLIAIPLLWFFCSVTGFQSSAIRATIMMSIVIAGWSIERPVDLLNSLAGAAFIILVWEPRQLFHAGFQLSFFVVLSIALLLPQFEKVRERLVRPDPFLPPELRPRWQRWLDGPIRFLTTSLATSIAAWLGSAPLVATYFHLFTPVSLLANLLIVPLAAPALASCLGSFICGDRLPFLSELFNNSAWLWMNLMSRLSEWASNLPGAWTHVAAPSPAAIAFYYIIIALVLRGNWSRDSRGRTPRLIAAIVAASALTVCLLPRGGTPITVLALRGGSAIYIDPPGAANDLLIDCGNESNARSIVLPFLHSRGKNGLAKIILTHGDLRHVGGYDFLKAEMPLGATLFSPVPSRSPPYRQIVSSLPTNAMTHISLGNRIGNWRVLHPAADDRFPRGDDNAIVLLGNFNGLRVLLLSDLGDEGQPTLFNRNPNLRADIVIAGLPGAGAPLKSGLLDAIRPQAIIVNDAYSPAGDRARPALRERLARHADAVFYTSDSRSVTIEIGGSGATVHATSKLSAPFHLRTGYNAE